MGLAIAVVRDVIPPTIWDVVFTEERRRIPTAPALGLLLDKTFFHQVCGTVMLMIWLKYCWCHVVSGIGCVHVMSWLHDTMSDDTPSLISSYHVIVFIWLYFFQYDRRISTATNIAERTTFAETFIKYESTIRDFKEKIIYKEICEKELAGKNGMLCHDMSWSHFMWYDGVWCVMLACDPVMSCHVISRYPIIRSCLPSLALYCEWYWILGWYSNEYSRFRTSWNDA